MESGLRWWRDRCLGAEAKLEAANEDRADRIAWQEELAPVFTAHRKAVEHAAKFPEKDWTDDDMDCLLGDYLDAECDGLLWRIVNQLLQPEDPEK